MNETDKESMKLDDRPDLSETIRRTLTYLERFDHRYEEALIHRNFRREMIEVIDIAEGLINLQDYINKQSVKGVT